MNKFLRYILVTSFISFATNAVADTKLGYVDVERILKESPPAMESMKKLQKEFSQRGEEVARLHQQIGDKENAGSSKAQELAGLRLELERKQRELNEDVSMRKKEELAVLQDRINKAVTTVSEAEGYDLVIYSGLAYTSKRIDLTDKVLKSLGKPTP